MTQDQPATEQKLSHYRFVFERASDPTLVTDCGGRVLFVNRAAREQGPHLEHMLDPHGAHAAELAQFRDELETYGRAYVELRVGERDIAVEGRVHGAQRVVMLRDVSERRRLESKLDALRTGKALPSSTRVRIAELTARSPLPEDSRVFERDGHAVGAR